MILTIAITVMTLLLSLALPRWSQEIRRDKEEELRFRGLQYAEAIRVFQARFGRFPVRLEELIEVKPRSIRKLWKDPMTDSGKWGLVFAGIGPGGQNAGQAGAPPTSITLGEGGDEEDANGRVTVGPIRGVYSRSEDESIATFMGQQAYNKWLFTVDLLQGGPAGRAVAGGAPGQAVVPGLPSLTPMAWIGRPFRPFLEQQIPAGGGGPGGIGPGGPGGPGGGGQPGAPPPAGGKPGGEPETDASGRPIS